ncbi:Protein Iojap/ribosomal silencing factor RsfS protein [Dioscorea alata]|uniref:Protein Iojap/ribosomal silencing factor RsfS protein n=1 Tax=Dioscorea alata TaxID=55571 RepID=A0ACB7WAF9_DIOAL|nr:Protein Iojap/ribosomal silencing factor RsfS protein [Dioscorea alata]
MMAALRSSFSSIRMQPWTHLGLIHSAFSSSSSSSFGQKGFLDLEEVEKILSDVKADDVRVIPVGDQCEWTDYMVVATGRSAWHVRNIAQALIYKVG